MRWWSFWRGTNFLGRGLCDLERRKGLDKSMVVKAKIVSSEWRGTFGLL